MQPQTYDPNQSYAGVQQQQNYAQGQSNAYQGQAQNLSGQTGAAYGNLQAYQKSLQDPSSQLGNVYGQNLQTQNQYYGVNPQAIQQQAQAIAQTQQMMAGLPQAIQQQANGRMVTGAQEAARYGQALAPYQQALSTEGTNLTALQQGEQVAQQAANQQTGYTGQSQQMQLGALQNVYADAFQQYQNAQSQVQYFQTLKQQGYTVDSQLYSAQAAMVQAQAQAETAQANMIQANVAQQQQTLLNNAAGKTGYTTAPNANGSTGLQYLFNGQPISVQDYNAGAGKNINPLFGQNIPNVAAGSPGASFAAGYPSFGSGFGGSSVLNSAGGY